MKLTYLTDTFVVGRGFDLIAYLKKHSLRRYIIWPGAPQFDGFLC